MYCRSYYFGGINVKHKTRRVLMSLSAGNKDLKQSLYIRHEDIHQNEVEYMSGWLLKQKAVRKRNRAEGWTNTFFTLRGNTLSYYTPRPGHEAAAEGGRAGSPRGLPDMDSMELAGVIPLNEVTVQDRLLSSPLLSRAVYAVHAMRVSIRARADTHSGGVFTREGMSCTREGMSFTREGGVFTRPAGLRQKTPPGVSSGIRWLRITT